MRKTKQVKRTSMPITRKQVNKQPSKAIAVGKAVGSSLLGRIPGVSEISSGVSAYRFTKKNTRTVKLRYNNKTGELEKIKRRKGLIPKQVKKWTNKTVKKRKAQDKVLNHLLSMSGAKRMIKKKSQSQGIITASELKEALRR